MSIFNFKKKKKKIENGHSQCLFSIFRNKNRTEKRTVRKIHVRAKNELFTVIIINTNIKIAIIILIAYTDHPDYTDYT
jgi:hypothetical protein